jgi:transposase-like protein
MLSQVYHCQKCSATNLVKNGTNASGSQRYKCKDCGVYRVLAPAAQPDKEAVLRMDCRK